MDRQRRSDRAARQQQLLRLVADQQEVRVGELSETLRVSEVTIRADLRGLEASGQLRRVWGGARPAPDSALPLSARAASSPASRMAVALVRSGDTVVIDGADLSVALATAAVERSDLADLTIVATSVAACAVLAGTEERFDVHVLGGRMVNDLLVPRNAARSAGSWWELALLTCHRIDPDGIVWHRDAEHAETSRQIAAATKRLIVIAEHDLGEARGGEPYCRLADLDALILSSATDRAFLDRLPLDGVQVLVAG